MEDYYELEIAKVNAALEVANTKPSHKDTKDWTECRENAIKYLNRMWEDTKKE